MMKTRICALLLALLTLLAAGCSSAEEQTQPENTTETAASATETPTPQATTASPEKEETSIITDGDRVDEQGNLTLVLTPKQLEEAGYSFGDNVSVVLENGKSFTMPVVLSEEDVAQGKLYLGMSEEKVKLAIKGGSFLLDKRLAVKNNDGTMTFSVSLCGIKIVLKEKDGYFDAWNKLTLKRSDKREDYPLLTDAEYANFRAVQTSGMGIGKLYRSTSPINPSYNRSAQSDAATRAAGVRTVINLTDDEADMPLYAGYADTYYSTLQIFAESFVMDFTSDSFSEGFARALRYMIEHDGPYLIHCHEGKDRTGFVCAVLEALMGATADQIVEDYMRSYINFYGVEKGSARYDMIAERNIEKTLCEAFGVTALNDAQLSLNAADYLKRIGLTDGEIASLKEKLG